ncbi:TolC family outer membrane protein [Actibacterium ureilyticum]|uniref:TolC family outer membrane protein n=1 Tax=Actibacterium ureilyticum TaxID=1590614 RepID=UPI000BAAE8FD|nr:TolC family outer membrane protein [Actibacterium ureilyticum]
MKKIRNFALSGVVAMGAVFGSVPLHAETLTDALVAAYKKSDLLDQNRAVLRAADEDVAQAVAALRPVLDFVAQARYNDPISSGTRDSGSISLGVDWDLFTGGRNKLGIEIAKESVLATRAALLGVEQGVLLNAVRAYMNVRSALRNVLLGQSNVRLITEELRASRDRFEVGEVTRTDVSIAEAALAAARSNLAAREGELAAARESYNRFIGHYPGQLTGTPRVPKLPATLDAARSIAQRSHPDIIQAQHQVTAAELRIASARGNYLPTVTAGLDHTIDDHGDESTSANVTLRQRIYQGGARNSAERQAINNKQSARSSLLNTVRLVQEDVGNAWSDLAVARAQITASNQQIRSARLAYDGTREEAKLGSRTTLDVLDAEQDLLDAQAQLISSEANEYIAVYSVLASMGLLTVDHLNLGINTYDPAAYYNAVKGAPSHSIQGKKLDRVLKSLGKE